MVHFVCQYALAWAMQSEHFGTALAKVKACYNDMKKLNLGNFFLAPYYTVTICCWIYKVHAHNLSFGIITEVLGYIGRSDHEQIRSRINNN